MLPASLAPDLQERSIIRETANIAPITIQVKGRLGQNGTVYDVLIRVFATLYEALDLDRAGCLSTGYAPM